MKLSVLQENLAKAITTASRFASPRAQLPILGNILLSAQKTKVSISSTNLEISVSIEMGAKVDEKGEICIPARIISELVTNLPKDTITLESEKEQLKISSSGFSSKVLGMDSTDFPKIPTSLNLEKALNIPRALLLDAIAQVIFAASIDETRPVLTGVLFIWERGSLTLVATDGFRLSQKKIKIDPLKPAPQVILPKLILSELTRLEDGEEILYHQEEKEKQVVFGVGEVVLSSRVLEGEYPDFAKIIPKESPVNVLIDKEELLRGVKLASVFAREGANIVKLKLTDGSVKVSAESSAAGSQETKVDAKIEGSSKDFEIAFNYRFLEEFLHSVKGEEVKMEFSGPDRAGVFTDTSDPSYLHLIMPVKIQG